MDCQLFERQVQRGIDGLLAAREQQDMLKHAAACPDCAALLQDMTDLDGLLYSQLSAVEAPEGFADAVMAALPAPYAKTALRLAFPRQRWVRFGSMAAAAVLLIAGGVYGLLPSNPGADPTVGPADPTIVAQEPGPDLTPQPLPAKEDEQEDPAAAVDPNHGEDPSGLEESGAPDQTQDPAEEAGDPSDQTQPKPQTPVQIAVAEPLPHSVPVDLSKPFSYSPLSEGVLSLTLLAAYEDCDAILPSINSEGLVEFYLKYKGQNHLWTQTLTAEAAPEYQGQVKYLPSLAEITGSVDESSVVGYAYVSAASPDQRIMAVNRGGESYGVWLYNDLAALAAASEDELGTEISGGVGGGKVLSWSPDGNKLLYTDAAGKLFVYYLAEELPLPLYNGIVSCASWDSDSMTVVFAGKEEKNQHSSVYTIQVP